MRRHTLQVTDILTGTDMSADIKGAVIDVSACDSASVHLVWTGTPTGTWRLQASNDEIPAGVGRDTVDYDDLTWIDVDTQAVAGAAGSKLFTAANMGFRWLTLFWDDTSGTGTVTVHNAYAKGQ